jgi:hypothetical protein
MSDSIRDLLAREAAEAEARADAEERGEAEPAPGQRGRRRAADPSQVYAVRIPVSRLRELKEVADKLDIPPTTLIRQWVMERLDGLHAETSATSGASSDSEPPAAGEVWLGERRRRDIRAADRLPFGRERRRA